MTTKKHGASGNGSKKSLDQSITGFNHENLGIDTSYVQISVISAEIWRKIEFSVMAVHFVPVYLFWTILSKVPSYNWFYNVIWPSKPGFRHLICAAITDNGRYMIQNIIFANGGTFCPGLPFSDHFDKGTPSRFVYLFFWYQETQLWVKFNGTLFFIIHPTDYIAFSLVIYSTNTNILKNKQ